MQQSTATGQTSENFLVLGDSLVAYCDWQPYLPAFSVHNFGTPGATTRDLRYSLTDIQRSCAHARYIMVMIGTNDVVMENYGFLTDLHEILAFLEQEYHGANIIVTSLLPMQLAYLAATAIERLNDLIRSAAQATNCTYIDVYTSFQKAGQTPFEADGVHLNVHGYAIWTKVVMQYVDDCRE